MTLRATLRVFDDPVAPRTLWAPMAGPEPGDGRGTIWLDPAGRQRDERGQVGGVEALVFGVLVLVLGILGVATAWAVVDAKVAAASAAREAARAYVESDGSEAAWPGAADRGREAFAGHGRDPAALELPRPPEPFGRCGPVTVTASTTLDLPRLPGIRAVARRVRVQASHTEVVDPYRAGVGRGAGCA